MATAPSTPSPLALEMEQSDSYGQRSSRFGRGLKRWLGTLLLLTIVAGGAAVAYTYYDLIFPAPDESRALVHTIERSDLLVTVTEDGALESASNVDIKCEVAGGSTILWIVPDGTQVKEGDELVRLDSSVFEEQVSQQQILFERAQALRIESQKLFSAAKIAVQEYEEGTYLQLLQTCESNITVALENQRSAQNSLEHTERMARKGYVTSLQRDAQKFAVQRASLDLETARIAKNVLEKFTRAKMMEDLEAKRDAAEAKMRGDEAAFELESARLKRLKLQFEKCRIVAPSDGMVVYANETSSFRGSTTVQIEEGASVRERQSIIKLPDLSRMQAKASIHESKIESLRIGMRARVRVQGREFQGSIVSIANQPEPSSFFSSNVKKFATIVSIEAPSDENGNGTAIRLKPGMTAVVEILIDDRKDVLTVPFHAVVEQGGKFYCWVMNSGRPERRPLALGVANDESIEVKDGLSEGDKVILNPRAQVPEARAEVKEDRSIDVAKTFGETRVPTPDEPAAPNPSVNGAEGPQRSTGPTGAGRGFDLSQFDKDGDQKLSREEAPERMQPFFDQIDTDHDGFLTLAELAALRKRFPQPPGGDTPALQQDLRLPPEAK